MDEIDYVFDEVRKRLDRQLKVYQISLTRIEMPGRPMKLYYYLEGNKADGINEKEEPEDEIGIRLLESLKKIGVDFPGANCLEIRVVINEKDETSYQDKMKKEASKKRWYRFFFRKWKKQARFINKAFLYVIIKMKAKIFYDKDYDCLMISEKADNEIVEKNFMFDDITISLTGSGKIVGIEIKDVSNYLEELGYNREILDNIIDGQLVVNPKKDFLFIGFEILGKTLGKEQRIPVATIPISCIN